MATENRKSASTVIAFIDDEIYKRIKRGMFSLTLKLREHEAETGLGSTLVQYYNQHGYEARYDSCDWDLSLTWDKP